MGAAISAVWENLEEADRAMEEKKKQDLEIMQRMVDAQLDKYEGELNTSVAPHISYFPSRRAKNLTNMALPGNS